MKYKDNKYDKKAIDFIKRLASLTDDILSRKLVEPLSEASLIKETSSLKKLFDSFAIINKFTSILIIDCYHEIKISLMKWERFADKESKVAAEFKTILEQMYEVMDDLYHYEYFGFFSTSSLIDEQLEILKNFVIKNRGIIGSAIVSPQSICLYPQTHFLWIPNGTSHTCL